MPLLWNVNEGYESDIVKIWLHGQSFLQLCVADSAVVNLSLIQNEVHYVMM